MKFTERDIKVAIASAILAMIVSVVALDMHGYIKHSSEADAGVVDIFELRAVGTEASTKVSPKAANREAFCADGYLLLRPRKNVSGDAVAGILVNQKMRPIPCSQELPAPGV